MMRRPAALVVPIVLALASAASPGSVAAAVAAPLIPVPATVAPAPATLVVAGNATVDRPPDRAIVRLQIATAAPSAAASTSANASAYAALGQRLAALGLAPAAIVTASFTSSFQPTPPPAQRSPDGMYGYVTLRALEVRVTPLAHAGAVIDAAAAIGSVSVTDVTFDLADRAPAKREALGDAVRDARSEADAIAGAAGVRIVRVVSIESGAGGYQPRPLALAGAVVKRMAVEAPTDLAPSGPVETTATVTITYEIR